MFGSSGAAGQPGSNLMIQRSSNQAGDFIGTSSRDANQGFVGSRSSGATGTGSSRSSSNRSGSSRYGSSQYGSSQYGSSNRGGGSTRSSRGGRNTQAEVRAVVRLGFQAPRPVATEIAPQLQSRLQRIMALAAGEPSGVRVRIENGTATLQGTVATDHARVIAERLALLEAGIWKVNNELVVADSTPPADSP
jgi:hypothetical protein